jgi:hypothetical protein
MLCVRSLRPLRSRRRIDLVNAAGDGGLSKD